MAASRSHRDASYRQAPVEGIRRAHGARKRQPQGRRPRVRDDCGGLRLRQDHISQNAAGYRRAEPRFIPDRRAAAPRGTGSGSRHRVPALFAVPAPDRDGESVAGSGNAGFSGPMPPVRRAAAPRAGQGARTAGGGGPAGRRGEISRAAIGRHAAAPVDCAVGDMRTEDTAVGRAVRRVGSGNHLRYAHPDIETLEYEQDDHLHGDPRLTGKLRLGHARAGVRQGTPRQPGAGGIRSDDYLQHPAQGSSEPRMNRQISPDEYVAFDATGLAELVHRGEVTPQSLAEAAIERIDALNPQLNAVVERSFDAARSAALVLDLRAALAGVPFLAKDINIEVAGLRLTASCRWLSELPPAAVDAPLAARWRAAGLLIMGRTNTPEFAEEFVTEPTWRGATRNPWDLTRSPGGSSGGAAAAVASGMVPIAHGTDSGGSIRVPAAACGLVGFKTSRGWVPVGPHLDEFAGGALSRQRRYTSVRESLLLLGRPT